jgi:hypothetical protein
MEDAAEEKKTSKLQSRKFIVWLTWLIISLGVIALSFIRTTSSDDLILEVLKYFFGVSMLYLGVNVAQKYIPAINNKESANE